MAAVSTTAAAAGSLTKVAQALLGVSEPDPRYFGNEANPRSDPAWTNANWLKSRFHFSFAEYSNAHNSNFGVLRVMNDDLVQPKRGFGRHPHRDAEICTYVIEGELTHQDSMGTSETLGAGSIQFMTAGRGVSHSEQNLSPAPLRFIQMWLTPRQRGLPPNYGSSRGDATQRSNNWHHMVSDVQNTDVKTDVEINADANMYAAEIEAGKELVLTVEAGRQAYVLCIDGASNFRRTRKEDAGAGDVCADADVTLQRHDASEIVGPMEVQVTGPSHLLVVEMAYDARSHGRTDNR
jgi:redox-sensitive bicupin YhaK (pirin superfamily)